jgi:hypothetical protein
MTQIEIQIEALDYHDRVNYKNYLAEKAKTEPRQADRDRYNKVIMLIVKSIL